MVLGACDFTGAMRRTHPTRRARASRQVTAVSGSVYHSVPARDVGIRLYQIAVACNDVVQLPESRKTNKYPD